MNQRIKLTCKERCTVKSGAVVEIPVNETLSIFFNKSPDYSLYGKFYLRKKLAMQGIIQLVHTPFPTGYCGVPTIAIKNDSINDLELLSGEELGEVWIFKG